VNVTGVMRIRTCPEPFIFGFWSDTK